MSVRSDIRRALRPAQLEPWEDRGLFAAVYRAIRSPAVGPNDSFVLPSVTKAGKPYMLTLHLRGRVIDHFDVDLAPDMDSPEMQAFLARRAEFEAERGAPYGEPAPSPDTTRGGGDGA